MYEEERAADADSTRLQPHRRHFLVSPIDRQYHIYTIPSLLSHPILLNVALYKSRILISILLTPYTYTRAEELANNTIVCNFFRSGVF